MNLRTAATVLFLFPSLSWAGWGGGSSSTDYSSFGDALSRDWLYDGSYISIKVEGCVWGYVYDNEEAGCLEDSSEDGTTYWYQMANCRRAQVAFSLYASGSKDNCHSGNYKETFVTTVGLSEFIDWMAQYDPYSPFSNNNDDGGNNGWNYDELPVCEAGNNGYVGLGCNSDGTFSINTFDDQYCLYSSSVYDNLNQLNYKLKTYKNCQGLSNTGDGGDNEGENHDGQGGSLAENLVYYATSCSSIDSPLCSDTSVMQSRRSGSNSIFSRHRTSTSVGHKSWTTKVKYVMGGFLLVASLIMFTGILFTNRRRRKALMQRKFRQSSRGSRRSKSSRSKSRDDQRRSRSSRRSKSKSRENNEGNGDGGVYT